MGLGTVIKGPWAKNADRIEAEDKIKAEGGSVPNESGLIAGVPPTALEGMSLYEKKCVLINHEIDSNGMGKYQWYIWFLCGFGYFLDLLWAQAFGLVLSPLEQELGFPGNQSGNISVRGHRSYDPVSLC